MTFMRRKKDALMPLEADILSYANEQHAGFYGWQYAAEHPEIPHGTIYRSLSRLEERGCLSGTWVAPSKPGTPPKRTYVLTTAGKTAEQTAKLVPAQTPWHGRLSARAI